MIALSSKTLQKKDIATAILFLFEGLLLLLMTLAFWYDNTIRPMYFSLFWLAIPIFIMRWHLTGRLWTHTILHDLLIVFILLMALNYTYAPFQKESFLAAAARPLSGTWTFVYFVELARTSKRLDIVLIVMLGMSFILACVALSTSQWLQEKTGFLWLLTDYLPRVDYRLLADRVDRVVCSPIVTLIEVSGCFNFAEVIRKGYFSFNVNEIAGALVWIAPVLAGITITPNPTKDNQAIRMPARAWMIIRLIAGLGFGIALIALVFGQSRFAMIGLLIALSILVYGATDNPRLRLIGWSGIALILILQALLFFNVFSPTSTEATSVGISTRDENSVNTRLQIWDRGLTMMTDYPMTGIGMYMFRTAVAQNPYVIPYFAERNNPPPHAHNEWFHMGAEMGIFGLMLFCAMQVAALRMVWVGWRQGDAIIRMIALSAFAGLLAHAIYGIGDTIALWDRFQFVLWWVLGLVGAQYVLAMLHAEYRINDMTIENI